MQTKRDLVHAYRFSTGRLVSAVATGGVGTGQSPFQRAGLGVAAGTAIGVLAAAGALVWGFLHPVTTPDWKHPNAIVVNSATGTRFLYTGGELHPVANYASAMLASGGRSPVQVLDASDLKGVPVGPAIGIPGAPQTLPAPGGLLTGGWADCLDPAYPGATVIDFGTSAAPAPPAGERILVTAPGGARYIIRDGTKYALPSRSALVALGLGNDDSLIVPRAWLDGLPSGPALVPAPTPGAGQPGPAMNGHPTVIGELFETTAAGVRQYYVLRPDGLAPVSGTELALLSAVPGARPPVTVNPADIAALPASAGKSPLSGLPDLASGPVYAPGGPALCVRYPAGKATAGTLVTQPAATMAAVTLHDGRGVLVPSGEGMLATSPRPAGAYAQPPTYLITDTGEKYPLPGASANTQAALGLGSASPRVLPAATLNLIPTGPALTVAAARETVTSWAG